VKRYIIITGNERYQQVAVDMTQAVVAAFQRRAPRSPGLLTRARVMGKHPWMYIDTSLMLQRAGYQLKTKGDAGA
jgi:hypothetical protein